MKTPKEYLKNLKNGKITIEMLENAIFSVNKRAKNYRDRERLVRSKYYNDRYDEEEKCRNKKNELYKQKEFLLSFVNKPSCIHQEKILTTRRIFDYQDEYENIKDENVKRENYYIEKPEWMDDDEWCDEENGIKIYFKDIWEFSYYKYYLFYQFPNFSFHVPIENKIEAEKIAIEKNIEIIEIDSIKTEGEEVKELLSMQFINKLIEFLKQSKLKVS